MREFKEALTGGSKDDDEDESLEAEKRITA
jgi:hypothetical protein